MLDLYAGSGALGFELLSRGALSVVLVEQDRAALAAARASIETIGLVGVSVIPADVAVFAAGGHGPFDIVVADPPYDLAGDDVAAVFKALFDSGSLAPAADLIVERRTRSGELSWPAPLTAVRSRRYGDTLLCYGRAP